ncbi:MAG: hypothetical protein KAT75_04315 [Dehalococcoidia bacterium]|nr:hypothetical protein [Dehalococcoidia bacterium]
MNYKEQCWFCGQNTMQPVNTWYKCTSCGATWVDQPELGMYMDVKVVKGPKHTTTSGTPVKKRGRVIPPLSNRDKKAKRDAKKAGQPLY